MAKAIQGGGLSEADLTLEDRIMILADIFEALTSHSRPYKGAMKLSEAFSILDAMVDRNEIDKQMLEFFKTSDALKQYVKEEISPEQVDEF
ncbi:HD domain-containing phosphohydrolase [Campylobacter mucosalis]|uniref:HD domain-containing phosphohydrolase n=1 Tax=Campylobacter mucosalis TaxID=202 RepID=UPI00147052A4|nr:HD domain-containing phosphohydrolase [Campylobacter mucosalis]